MNLIDIFDINTIFKPDCFYEGDLVIEENEQEQFLMENAKIINGKNLYNEFLQEKFYSQLQKISEDKTWKYMSKQFSPKILITDKYNKNSRSVYWTSSVDIIATLMRKFDLQITNEELDYCQNDPYLLAKYGLRKKRKEINDVLKNKKYSQYFNYYWNLYQNDQYSQNNEHSFGDYLNKISEYITKCVIALRYLPEFLQTEINHQDLIDCFDYDKLCLCLMKGILNASKLSEKLDNSLENSIISMIDYVEAINELKEKNKYYQCKINIKNPYTNETKIYTSDDAIREYNDLLVRHPEFKFIRLSKNLLPQEEFITNSKEATDILLEYIKKELNPTEITTNWKLIPTGTNPRCKSFSNQTNTLKKIENIFISEINKAENNNQSLKEKKLTDSEKKERMIFAKQFLDNSSALYYIEGIDKFEGYIGYIYANGKVIFEKYYDDINKKKVASGNATYVMNFDKFVELSKLSKSEIISKINHEGNKDIQRIYHTTTMKSWFSKVKQTIIGQDQTPKVTQYIDSLVETNYVKRKIKN